MPFVFPHRQKRMFGNARHLLRPRLRMYKYQRKLLLSLSSGMDWRRKNLQRYVRLRRKRPQEGLQTDILCMQNVIAWLKISCKLVQRAMDVLLFESRVLTSYFNIKKIVSVKPLSHYFAQWLFPCFFFRRTRWQRKPNVLWEPQLREHHVASDVKRGNSAITLSRRNKRCNLIRS